MIFILKFYVINTSSNLPFQPYYSNPQTYHQHSEIVYHVWCNSSPKKSPLHCDLDEKVVEEVK